ncbi:signal recognition particle-docking protein FtsY [Desulfobulbus oralis]|nr:signal recognition particle-docking protein FtsY [Desulfobulbus oralis]
MLAWLRKLFGSAGENAQETPAASAVTSAAAQAAAEPPGTLPHSEAEPAQSKKAVDWSIGLTDSECLYDSGLLIDLAGLPGLAGFGPLLTDEEASRMLTAQIRPQVEQPEPPVASPAEEATETAGPVEARPLPADSVAQPKAPAPECPPEAAPEPVLPADLATAAQPEPESLAAEPKLQAEPPVAEEKAAAEPPAPETERSKPEPAPGPIPAETPAVGEKPAVQPEPAVRKAAERAESEPPAGQEAPQATGEPAAAQEAAAAAEAAEVQAAAPGEKPAPAPEDEAIPEASPKSMFRRLQERLGKTRNSFVSQLDQLFLGKKAIDQELFDELEELLITADLGVNTTMELLDEARKRVKRGQLGDASALKALLKESMLNCITAPERDNIMVPPENGPLVVMVVGVNGVGKTTTIGKIAARMAQAGKSVLLVAGDTFRAAAIDQLKVWGERTGCEVVARKPGADPASVAFDGLDYGIAHNKDVILIDTAGRLHTSVNLMAELKKVRRVLEKRLPGAPHEILQVLDATTGQNGLSQARLFHEAVGVTCLALTKLDGTAKGGIVANISRQLKIPVRFIGIGEQIDDLRDFDAREFVEALFTENKA